MDVSLAATAGDDVIRPRLYPNERDCAAADALLHGRVRPLVAVAPGSVWATKRWPHYAALCQRLLDDFDVAVIGAAGDAEPLSALLTDSRIIDATGKLSLLGSAALIERAKVIVTNDSSPQHLASAVGTPTVTVFGPTVPEFGFGPLAPGSRVVGRTDLACRPCDRHGPQRCPLGHWRCMREIDAHDVFSTVTTVIHRSTPR
jgi:heptosyltransferase-2